jgi:NADPH-dependent ferric siderophore reductase
MPTVRTYTALFPDVERGTLAIDFVIHGDQGVAGPWVSAAEPGDQLLVNGPGGGYLPDPAADWHLLVGDESALPAITATLTALHEDSVVRVIALVDSPDHEPVLPLPRAGRLRFLYRDGDDAAALTSAVQWLDWLPGRAHAVVHGEAQEIMHGVRPHLFRERGLARDQVSISGYWRRRRTEESRSGSGSWRWPGPTVRTAVDRPPASRTAGVGMAWSIAVDAGQQAREATLCVSGSSA